jgi:hypothetical protein
LARLVVQFTREALSLELLAFDDTAERVPSDPARKIDGDRRAGGELL